MTSTPHGGQNEQMTGKYVVQQPFQFPLWSLFVATSAIAMVVGMWDGFGPETLIGSVQFWAVITVLVKSKGTAWPGMVIVGLIAALFSAFAHFEMLDEVAFLASLAAWFAGGLTASEATRKESDFLRWSWLLAPAWFLFVWIISPAFVIVD